jgi:hypothetical protein
VAASLSFAIIHAGVRTAAPLSLAIVVATATGIRDAGAGSLASTRVFLVATESLTGIQSPTGMGFIHNQGFCFSAKAGIRHHFGNDSRGVGLTPRFSGVVTPECRTSQQTAQGCERQLMKFTAIHS